MMKTFKEFLQEEADGGATCAGDVSGPGGTGMPDDRMSYATKWPDSKLFKKLAKRKKPASKSKKKKKKKSS